MARIRIDVMSARPGCTVDPLAAEGPSVMAEKQSQGSIRPDVRITLPRYALGKGTDVAISRSSPPSPRYPHGRGVKTGQKRRPRHPKAARPSPAGRHVGIPQTASARFTRLYPGRQEHGTAGWPA